MIVKDYEVIEIDLGNGNRKFELRKKGYKPKNETSIYFWVCILD